MFKKLKSTGFVLFASAIATGVIMLLLSFFRERIHLSVGEVLIISTAVFIVVSVTFGFVLRKFVFEKLRTIFGLLQQRPSEFGTDYMDTLSEMEEKSKNWAYQKKKEIIELRKQQEYRTEFLGNLAHELKTPLFAIQGYVLTLLEGGVDDPNVNKLFLEKASVAIDRMNHLLDDLDQIAKFENTEEELIIKSFDIRALALDVIEERRRRIEAKNLIVHVNKDVPVLVMGDERRLRQVLDNLIGNAIKYVDDNDVIQVNFERMNTQMSISIEDNGPGIPKEDLGRLFERFFRVEKSRSRNVAGSGLGLSIVKHIVNKHNSDITVDSIEGEGTKFVFNLPVG